ncbi:MAG: lipopolysaccharide biosynthesis [Desulfobulbaceae bacterium]|nr:MAG: lipopolysaccharide biosynthesis [Desulfobulbaceae bacterium]
MPNSPQNLSPVRVAILLPSLQVGGAERLVLEELNYLKDDPRFAFEVHLVFDEGPFFEELSGFGLPVYVWRAPHKSIRMIKIYWDISRHLRQKKCDVLHCHLLNSIGSLLGKLAGVPTVTTAHGDIAFKFWARFGFKRSALVLGCGEKVAKNLRRFVKRSKVGVLNNAVQSRPRKYSEQGSLINKLELSPNSFLLLTLGRLTQQKGYDILIHAMQKVVLAAPEAVLLIGGEGSDLQQLQELIKLLSLEKHVQLLGVVDNTHELLEQCHIYINSSRWEGLPMTLLEAMSHGKPIIATNVGGNPDVIIDGETGLLVEPADVDALSQSILTLLRDSVLRDKMAMEAKKLFLAEYGIEKHCEKLAAYYLSLV